MSGIPVEHYYRDHMTPMHNCEHCGRQTYKIEATRFAVVFTGPITARYNDRDKEGAHKDGHWGFEKGPDGKTKPTFIETFDQQREFCRRNNLMNPKDVGRNYEVAEDGKTALSPMGMPGVEV